ncbi:unnamed protein product [Lactuca virosa]|uniref:LRAT domain-containing protein n=1 Tax=Lactuca virosa TaxID=75947 RepID=A0AAU9NFC0_9ASTR|nr:unnamed protein product [Lactuca virosa]
MGLLSNRLDKKNLKPGDHIYSWRHAYIYAHHGVYLGDDKVVHFTRLGQEVGTGTGLDVLIISSMPPPRLVTCPTCNHTDISNGIITSCLNCFLNGGLLYRFEYSVNPVVFLANPRGGTCTLAASDPPETVIHRANYLVKNGFGCYNILKNNCIHFAIYCKTGRLVSDKKTMSPSRLMASIIGQPLEAVFSSSLELMKASGVAPYCVNRYVADIGKKSDVIS